MFYFRQTLARGALRVRQVREAVLGQPPLRAQGPGLLRDPLPPALWKPLLRLQPGHPGRRLHRTQQGLVC